jgi:hypothetical protein
VAAKKSASSSGRTAISSPGKKPVTFAKGGLHQSLGVPQGQKIPAAKLAAAKSGKFGPVAQKQANFAAGMLAAGRKTAASNRRKKGWAMAIGDSGITPKHVPTNVPIPGTGPQPNADRVGKHVRGSGRMPGEGAESGEPSAQHPANTPRSGGIK